jgi:hypothetical protein
MFKNGEINLVKRIPEFLGKVFLWRVPDHEAGPGMYRYSERGPGLTSEERRSLEPWNYPQRQAVAPSIEHESGIERERSRERQR